MVADALPRVGDSPYLGLRGSGGGARSGSELSHLVFKLVSDFFTISSILFQDAQCSCQWSYIGIDFTDSIEDLWRNAGLSFSRDLMRSMRLMIGGLI